MAAQLLSNPPILPAVIERTAAQVFNGFTARLKAHLNGRQERALRLALNGHVIHKAGRVYSVRSETGNHTYMVDLDRSYCTCPDSQGGSVCKHRLAAYLIEQSKQAIPQNSVNEALQRAAKVFSAQSEHLQGAVVYAILTTEEQDIPVEVLRIEGEVATVRALPRQEAGRLVPHFPFPERNTLAQVLAACLTEITIYR